MSGATVVCPALLVSAPASGQGKTSVTAALARWHRRQGRRVRVFKSGPDFLDPLLLEQASGAPVYQLDLWMTGLADARMRLHAAAAQADLILVEGVMGLFDGTPSSADLAQALGLPVMVVVDGSAMAQTFGAVVAGMAGYRADLMVYGVAANRIGGAHHADLLRGSVPAQVQWLGALPRDARLALPERHLGLVAASEVADLSVRLDALADAWAAQASTALPPAVAFPVEPVAPVPLCLRGRRIAIARDAAFCFLYPANLDFLCEAGAELRFFSPLAGDTLPECDAVWLPGGYPELHLERLSHCHALHAALHAHHEAGRPILAECGGLLFALEALTATDGTRVPMAGLLRGEAIMQTRLSALGLQSLALPEGGLRGHTFHYAQAQVQAPVLAWAENPNGGLGLVFAMSARVVMVQGCTSDAGKSLLVTALCRWLYRQGVRVAPFKPQNMALNSAVTCDGGEIGRAQAVQAQACGVAAHTDFNPVLLKPDSDVGAQVIVHGRVAARLDAVSYHAYKPLAWEAVLASHRRLCQRYEAVVVEGAGSPAEINLRANDIANMGYAEAVDCPVILIADIDRGGVFAHLVGTLALLSDSERQRVQGIDLVGAPNAKSTYQSFIFLN
ncbi:hypothetical protein FQR65_LT20091 [Abscondita terminalis]|nr:hypothetical protein FQR65_LT20091 [Abscondita terminalis]